MDRPLLHLVTSISNAPALGYDELFSRLSVLFFLKALEISVAILLLLDTKALNLFATRFVAIFRKANQTD